MSNPGLSGWLAGLLALSLLLVSCSGALGQIKARLGKEFQLAIGQTAVISGENLKIKLLDVTGESRCPTGAQCIRAGEVSAVIEIGDSSPVKMTLIDSGLTAAQGNHTYTNYRLTFRVQPYPEVGKQIVKEDYRLHLILDKQK